MPPPDFVAGEVVAFDKAYERGRLSRPYDHMPSHVAWSPTMADTSILLIDDPDDGCLALYTRATAAI